MAMMEHYDTPDGFVSMETAKLLKECGFDEPVPIVVRDDDGSEPFTHKADGPILHAHADSFAVPTYQQAMEWLRKKGVSADVSAYAETEDCTDVYGPAPERFFVFGWTVTPLYGSQHKNGCGYAEWDEAADDAIGCAAEIVMSYENNTF